VRVRRAALVLILVASTLCALGCARIVGKSARTSRQEAIDACIEAVPRDTVPFGDAFAACMESYGWVYRSGSAPGD
jgi:hypothetical protein